MQLSVYKKTTIVINIVNSDTIYTGQQPPATSTLTLLLHLLSNNIKYTQPKHHKDRKTTA